LNQKSTSDGLQKTTTVILYSIINSALTKWKGKETENKEKYYIVKTPIKVDRKGFNPYTANVDNTASS
jgi:hypothetical protein